MAKLTGTNPDQVPTNADLGDMAYKDGENLQAGPLTIKDGKVGVGTTSPSSELHLSGGAYTPITIDGTSGGTIDFYRNGSRHAQIFTDNAGGDIVFRNNTTTERMRIGSAGDVDIANELIAGSYNETYAAVTSSSNATTVNCEAGNAFSHTLTENTTFTFSNPPASGTAYSFSIEIIQDASASGFTVTWPASVDWPSATAPTLTATASAKDVFVFSTRDGGTTWYGFTAGQALG
jgi:hypothetical protein